MIDDIIFVASALSHLVALRDQLAAELRKNQIGRRDREGKKDFRRLIAVEARCIEDAFRTEARSHCAEDTFASPSF